MANNHIMGRLPPSGRTPPSGASAFSGTNFAELLRRMRGGQAEGGEWLQRQMDNLWEYLGGLSPYDRAHTQGASDPKTRAHTTQRPDAQGGILAGRIVYSLPYAGWYRVQLEGFVSDWPCCMLSSASCVPTAVRSSSVLAPTDEVLVFRTPNRPYGFILGAVPQVVADPAMKWGDWIVQGSNGGFLREKHFRDVLRLQDGGGVFDFSGGASPDSSLGELTHMSPLGLGLHIGLALAYLRVNEHCGLFLNYIDNLLRLAGYNLDVRTSVSEECVRNDEGESFVMKGTALFPWEALGFFVPGVNTTRSNSDEAVLFALPEGKLEPISPDQVPFWRFREYGGYLGQGFLREVVLPPDVTSQEPNLAGTLLPEIGVFREHIGPDGAFVLASAHSVSILKRPSMPVARQLRSPESPSGDTTANYKFSGFNGDGEEQPALREPGFTSNDISMGTPEASKPFDLMYPSAWLDLQEYALNWRSLHQFHYHQRDWNVPEESQVGPPIFQRPDYGQLFSGPYIQSPEAIFQSITSSQIASYQPTCSGFSILGNGAVLLQGPAGEQIVLHGGNITLDCPGDVLLRPGRKFIAMAGDDAIVRANSSIDITSSNLDVRIKAERNIDVLAGNSGQTGRLLLETKSVGTVHEYSNRVGEEIPGVGIILRADNSELTAYAGQLYFRSTTGDIYLDANKGERQLYFSANAAMYNLGQSMSIAFPHRGGDSDESESFLFGATGCYLVGPMRCSKNVIIQEGGLSVGGNIAVKDGHIGTTKSEEFDGLVGYFDPESQSSDLLSLQFELSQQGANLVRDQLQQAFTAAFDEYIYNSNAAGSESFTDNARFSLRSEEQYGTGENYVMLRPFWQTLVTTSSFPTWQEPPVEYQNQSLYPYPGESGWTGSKMHSTKPTFIDPQTGYGIQRTDDVYKDPILDSEAPVAAEGNYLIITP